MPAVPLQSEEIWAPPVDLHNLEKKKINQNPTMSCGIRLSYILCKKCAPVPVVDTSKLCSTAAADQQQTGDHHCGRARISEQRVPGFSVKSRQEIKANT